MLVTGAARNGAALWRFRLYKVWLLLWLPLVFYALSIAYGSVPIFVPVWWPFSYYNVRYGLELLPVFAVFPVVLAIFVVERVRSRRRRVAAWALLIVCVTGSYLSAWAETPITLARGAGEFANPGCDGRGAGEFLVRVPKKRDHPDVRRIACGSAAACRHSAQARHQRSQPSRLGVGAARSGAQGDYIVAFQGDPVWAAAQRTSQRIEEVRPSLCPGRNGARSTCLFRARLHLKCLDHDVVRLIADRDDVHQCAVGADL